jgi:hypothetical protein
MEQEKVVQQQEVPTKKVKVKQRETTHAGKTGDWYDMLQALAANAADLPHLEVPRTQLASLFSQVGEIKKQQASSRVVKQSSSQQLQAMIADGQRLVALLRQAVKQHYGPRSEKLHEFKLKPFRGLVRGTKSTPQKPTPTPEPTPSPAAPEAAPKTSSDPASHA